MSTHKLSFEEACMLLNEGKVKQIESLIKENVDWITKTDTSGRRLLHWACLSRDEGVVALLIDHYKTPVDVQDDMLWSPLMIASSAGREGVVKLLVARGADPDTCNSNGQNSLHYACSKNHPKIAEFLISKGIDLNHADRHGNTPLHRTATIGRTNLTSLLVERGAVVDVPDRQGNTPLHLACQDERMEDAVVLVNAGARLDYLNKEQQSPMDFVNPKLRSRLTEVAKP